MGACQSSADGGSGSGSIAVNEAVQADIQNRISTRLKNNQNSTSIQSKTGQEVIIRQIQNDESSNPFFQSVTSEKKGPFGILGSKKNCPLFHCAYEVNQNASINISTYNSTVAHETENILSDIESSVQQQAETQLSSGGIDAANEALNEVRDELRENIQTKLTNLSEISQEDQQSVDIEYSTPLRCRDPCGMEGGPFGPKIDQNSMFNLHAEGILNSSMKLISEKFAEHDLEVEQSVSDENKACLIQLGISAVVCFVCLIVLWKIIGMAEQGVDAATR